VKVAFGGRQDKPHGPVISVKMARPSVDLHAHIWVEERSRRIPVDEVLAGDYLELAA
jgi:hypothetical protein